MSIRPGENTSPESNPDANAGQPITLIEMQALLDPLRSCIERMEITLRKLPKEALLTQMPTRTPRPSPTKAGTPALIGPANHPFYAPTAAEGDSAVDMSVTESPSIAEGADGDEDLHAPHHSASCFHMEDMSNHGQFDLVETMKINAELMESNFGKVSQVEKVLIQAFNKLPHSQKFLEEPVRQGLLNSIACSQSFQTACMIAITLNSALVACVADWQIRHVGETEPLLFEVLESSFLVFFIIELMIRFGAHRCYFFINRDMYWNNFDFVLVSISVVDVIFDKILDIGSGGNVGFMRLLRLLKLARIFRSLRSFRFFKSLAILLESFQKSFVSLFWGSIMLLFVLYLFSLIFLQGLLDCLNSDDLDADVRQNIQRYFHSLGSAFLALYMSVTGGNDWIVYYDLICCAGAIYGMMFILFTFILYFALFNILTGSLVEKAMTSSKPDRADRVLLQRKAYREQRQHFIDICKAMDVDQDGMLSWTEFERCLSNPAVLAYLASIGMEIHDVQLFFDTVAKTDFMAKGLKEKMLPIDHFVEGCMHMKGTASSIDMQRQLVETHMLHEDVRRLQDLLNDKLYYVEQLLKRKYKPKEQESVVTTAGTI